MMALSPMMLFAHRGQSSQQGPRKGKGLDIVLQPFRKFDLRTNGKPSLRTDVPRSECRYHSQQIYLLCTL